MPVTVNIWVLAPLLLLIEMLPLLLVLVLLSKVRIKLAKSAAVVCSVLDKAISVTEATVALLYLKVAEAGVPVVAVLNKYIAPALGPVNPCNP